MFNKQKEYFDKKLDGVQKVIWDFEFKRFKLGLEREEIRGGYDNLRSRMEVLKTQIKAQKEKPTMEKGEIARLNDQEVILQRDIDRAIQNMKVLDGEISGLAASSEHPEGVTGINQQLEALRELKQTVRDYKKTL